MEEADRLSDRVAIMDHGQLLVLDTPEDLKNTTGEGDKVTCTLKNDLDEKKMGELEPELEKGPQVISVKMEPGKIRLTALDAFQHIPSMFSVLGSIQDQIEDMKVHSTTLEDVFIHLTGRSLRED